MVRNIRSHAPCLCDAVGPVNFMSGTKLGKICSVIRKHLHRGSSSSNETSHALNIRIALKIIQHLYVYFSYVETREYYSVLLALMLLLLLSTHSHDPC